MNWFTVIGVSCLLFLSACWFKINWEERQAFLDKIGGRSALAAEEYKKVISDREKFTGNVDWEAHNSTGLTYERNGQEDKALAEYNIAIDYIEKHPYLSKLMVMQGQSRRRSSITTGSVYGYNRTLDRMSKPYNRRGYIYYQRHCYDQAIADFTTSINMYTQQGFPLSFRALCYRAKGQMDLAAKDDAELKKRGYAPSSPD